MKWLIDDKPETQRSDREPSGGAIAVAFIIALLLGLALALFVSAAHAGSLRVEGVIGQSKFSLAGDNVWWQNYMPHTEDLSDTAVQIGLSKHLDRFDGEPYAIGWRVAYVNLGSASNDATWNSDQNYNADIKTCSPWCAHSTSNWHVAGISAGGMLDWNLIRDKGTLGVGAGWFLYQSGGQVTYTTTVGRGLGGIDDGICEVGYSWHGTPYAELVGRYGHFLAAIREYKNISTQTGSKIGLLGGAATTAMVGLSIPF